MHALSGPPASGGGNGREVAGTSRPRPRRYHLLVITRLFRGRTKPGHEAAFERLIREEALPAFEANPGVLSVHFGTPTEASPNEFLVVTVWRDLASLRAYAGERWTDPKLSLEEAHLLESATVHHYRNGDREAVGSATLAGNGAAPEVLDLGALRVDLGRRTAQMEDERVELPPREFAVLAELALRPGRPVPSEELAKLAWPPSAWPSGEDVRRTVYRLRRLLGDHDREPPLIRNRRGHGYVLEA